MKREGYHHTSIPMAMKITICCMFLLCPLFNQASYPYMGGTLTLDGYDEYAWAPHSGSLDLAGDQLTMEAWVKLAGPTENHWIVSKQNIESNRSYGFYINGENRRVMPSIHADLHFEGEVGEGDLEYDTWYHVAVVYNGSKITTYINGLFNGEADLTGNLQQNLKELTIGGTYWSDTDTTNGSIDEVRIWSVARTQGEIQSALAVPLTGTEPGLVGYWRFDETEDLGVGGDGQDDFRDFSGNGNHVDFKFQASYPDLGNTIILDGYDEYAWAPHSGSLDLAGDQLTMEAWVKLAGPTENHWIVSKQNIESNRSYGFYINGENRRVMPSIHADLHFEGEVGEGDLEYDTWYHVAVVYNGSKITTYINGLFNGEADLTGNLQQNLKELTIGGTYWSDTDTTNGSIDEVRIWSVARTQGEIQSALAVPLTGTEPGLVGYWRFDETEDLGVGGDGQDDFRDFSGNGNHADWFYTIETCKTDFDRDGVSDGADLGLFIREFSKTDCSGGCYADFEPDGDVDEDDLAVFSANFGRIGCPENL